MTLDRLAVEAQAERLKTATSLPRGEITLAGVLSDEVRMKDLHSSREVPVVLQAGVTGASGRPQLKNPGRAVELVEVPESEILRIYSTLRPRHAGAGELLALAAELKLEYGVRRCVSLTREAGEAHSRPARVQLHD